jgi:general secretion pathway protein K
MKSRNGFALSIVMWIVAALLLGIVLILNLSKESLNLTKDLQDKQRARLEAQDYLELIKYYVITADFDSRKLINGVQVASYKLPKQIVLDGREYHPTKDVTISMQDASSMVNLLYPNTPLIASLASENEQKLYYTINDSIKDWTDKDGKISLNGAENDYYQKQKNVRYKPRNSPAIQSIDELRLIRGVDTLGVKTFDKLKKYLYFSQDGAFINMALLDSTYLSKILKIDLSTAQLMENYKQNEFTKFISMIQKNRNYNDELMGFALSFNIKIRVEVKVGNAVANLETFIDFRKKSSKDITTNTYRIY